MTLRKLSCLFGLAVVLMSSQWVLALGLGEFKLNSALNEPLDAEIRLLNVGELSATEIIAGLAPEEDFNRVGVERAFYLVELRFKVDVSSPGAPVIRVTSHKPIREPYLDFLLDVQWASGRLLREYTVLLDLPVYATDKPVGKPLAAAQSASRQTIRQEPGKDPTTSAPSTSHGAGVADNYRVQAGDTLWQIANRARPSGTTVQQAIVAIHRANPEAFIDGNINLLRKGAVLRMPNAQAFSATDHRQAIQIVASQTQDWREAGVGPQLDASSRTDGSTTTTVSSDGQLRLSALAVDQQTPSDSSSAVGSESGLAGSGSVEALQNEVAIAREEMDKTRRENSELKARLANLEEQLKLGRLVEIGDDELRAAQLASGVDDTTLAADKKGVTTEDTGSEDAAGEAEDIIAAEEDGLTPEAPGIEPEMATLDETAPDLSTQKIPQPEPVETGFLDAIKGYLLVIAGVVGFVVLAVSYLIFRQRSGAQTDNRDSHDFTRPREPARTAARREPVAEIESAAPDITSFDEIDLDEDDMLFAPEAESFDELELEFGDDEQVDPLGEADIYLSLGNYAEAEAILTRALAKTPDDGKLHLKMLELYTVQEDLEGFDAHYPHIRRLNDPGLAVEAAKLRAELAGEAVVTPAAELSVGTATALDSEDEFEFSLDEEMLASDIDTAAAADDDTEELTDADFDIELDLESELADVQFDELAVDALDTREKNVGSDAQAGAGMGLVESTEAADDLELSFEMEEPRADTGLAQEAALAQQTPLAQESTEFDLSSDFELLDSGDESATQLELAQAYMDMGDPEGAREILEEVIERGNAEQQDKARSLMDSLA